MIVTCTSGERRALSSILQNVFDAWMTLLGQPLPPISKYRVVSRLQRLRSV